MKIWRSNEEDKCGLNLVKFMSVFLVIPLLLWLAIVLTNPPSHGIWALLQARNFYFNFERAILEEIDGVHELPHEKSCVSRYELPLYRRGEARKPSPQLISKLGSYEARHRRCGPHTDSYNKTLVYLQSNTYMYNSTDLDCKYVVWLPCEGLGNQMLSLASAFLYALLTDRVLLAHRGKDFSDLFCEPFPEASLFLPSNFPLAKHFDTFNQYSNHSYGNLLNLTLQPYVYLNLIHDYPLEDQLFFCDQDQANLQHIPWLILKSDLYVVPSLFLMPMFQQELHHLFPEKDTVFHLLARNLFHPRNSVWGLVTRYYQAYLSKADVRVGIQVRVFDNTGPFTVDQIMSCIKTENILPPINYNTTTNSTTATSSSSRRISVVMASLRSSYMERIKDMYWENPTETGESVSVYQPSHEEYQQTEKLSHDRKALAEMYLLSLTDKLVTSGWSTFGYVGAALGGVKPWILQIPQNEIMPNPACGRAMSMEPCFHYPPYYQCKMRKTIDLAVVVPHVTPCEDVSWGIKLL